MVTMEQSRQGVTLLQFSRVIPSTAWLRASILWADDLAAVWPMPEPIPLSHAQEQPLQEVRSLLDAGLFERVYLADLFSPMTDTDVAMILDQAGIAGVFRPYTEDWLDGGAATGPAMSVSAGYEAAEYDPGTFLYPDKLPGPVIRELERRNLIRFLDIRGYTVTNAEILDQLLAIYARVLHERSGGRLLPDVEEPGQARNIAAPLYTAETRQALVLTIRDAFAPDLHTDFQRFVDFRATDKNERARREYIDHLTGLWELCARGGLEHAREQVFKRTVADLGKARESYFKRVNRQALVAQVLVSFGVVLPLTASHPAVAVEGALANIGASAVTVAVRNGAPRYIRRAIGSDLLAPTAT